MRCHRPQDEADTVGCCSLRVEHIRFPSDHEVELDFLGKDSMRYHQVIDFDRYGDIGRAVIKNLRRFAKGKQPYEDVFDQLTVRERGSRRCHRCEACALLSHSCVCSRPASTTSWMGSCLACLPRCSVPTTPPSRWRRSWRCCPSTRQCVKRDGDTTLTAALRAPRPHIPPSGDALAGG